MYRPLIFAALAIASVCASGEFVVLHSPDSVQFTGKQTLDQSLLKEVFSSALGFTPKKRGNWSGMFINNPFDLPEAVVGIAIEGIESLDSPRGRKFPLEIDEVEETTWQALSRRLEERDNDNTLVRICVSDGMDALGQSALGELKTNSIGETTLKSLSLNNEEDRKYIEDIKLLHAIAEKVMSTITANGKPDVYWLVVSGVGPLVDLYGKDSPAVKEALVLLNDALSDISKAFMDAYNDKVVIAAFTNGAGKVRQTRSVNLVRERRADEPKTSEKAPEKASENAPKAVGKETDETMTLSADIKNDEGVEEKVKVKVEVEEEELPITDGSIVKESGEIPSNTENEEAKNENKVEETKGENKVEETKSENKVEETKSENKVEETKSENKVEETKTENKVEETKTENKVDETADKESSAEKSSHELDGATHKSHTNTDTENTNRPLKDEDLNLAKKYHESYPAIFNIVLWFGVAFFFSLLAICIAIADMDPGRDSIIYRMTSNRMKKDN